MLLPHGFGESILGKRQCFPILLQNCSDIAFWKWNSWITCLYFTATKLIALWHWWQNQVVWHSGSYSSQWLLAHSEKITWYIFLCFWTWAGELIWWLAAAGQKDIPPESSCCCLQAWVEEGSVCSGLRGGDAEHLGALFMFAECRAELCLALPVCPELHRVRKQKRHPSLGSRVCVRPSVVSVVCICTVPSVACPQGTGHRKVHWKIIFNLLLRLFRKVSHICQGWFSSSHCGGNLFLIHTSFCKVVLTKFKYDLSWFPGALGRTNKHITGSSVKLFPAGMQ